MRFPGAGSILLPCSRGLILQHADWWMAMATDDEAFEFTSDLEDLRLIPLTQIAESGAGADALARILAERSSYHVPIAAFNSSI
jgi:FXSXX-COOH protein